MFDSLALAQLLQDGRLLVDVIVWNENRGRLANCFLGGITEDARPFVPTVDNPIEVPADDRILAQTSNLSPPEKLFVVQHPYAQ
jgi:hypothetical protein